MFISLKCSDAEVINVCYGQQETIFNDFDVNCFI